MFWRKQKRRSFKISFFQTKKKLHARTTPRGLWLREISIRLLHQTLSVRRYDMGWAQRNLYTPPRALRPGIRTHDVWIVSPAHRASEPPGRVIRVLLLFDKHNTVQIFLWKSNRLVSILLINWNIRQYYFGHYFKENNLGNNFVKECVPIRGLRNYP